MPEFFVKSTRKEFGLSLSLSLVYLGIVNLSRTSLGIRSILAFEGRKSRKSRNLSEHGIKSAIKYSNPVSYDEMKNAPKNLCWVLGLNTLSLNNDTEKQFLENIEKYMC